MEDKIWFHKNFLSARDFSVSQLQPVFELAAKYKDAIQKNISTVSEKNFIITTLFYEPSTRTRLSFESAALHLGIKVLSVSAANTESSATKGETLEDTGKMVSAYCDLVVVRHFEPQGSKRLAKNAFVPVINAGDGFSEHPTQALLDIFTMHEAFGTTKKLKVGLCGDLLYGRTVHSLLPWLVESDCEIHLISPPTLAMPSEIIKNIPRAADFIKSDNLTLQEALPKLDVLYMTRVQKERFANIDDYKKVSGSYKLTMQDLKNTSENLKIFHPLPRGDEIEADIDSNKRAHYFIQAANGVPVRMALMAKILGIY